MVDEQYLECLLSLSVPLSLCLCFFLCPDIYDTNNSVTCSKLAFRVCVPVDDKGKGKEITLSVIILLTYT